MRPTRLTLLAVLSLLVGCTTVVPLQTASTLPKNGYRLGGELSAAGWCGFSGEPSAQACASFPPPGTYATPEVRLNARYGVTEGFDLGASLHAAGILWQSYRIGLYVDGKVELWSRELEPGRRQILSIAPGLGYHSEEVPGTLYGIAELNAALPLLFGHQSEGFEWITGVGVVERLQFADSGVGEGVRRLTPDAQFLVLAGVISRAKLKPGFQLTYQAPARFPGTGMFTLSFGLSYDVLP